MTHFSIEKMKPLRAAICVAMLVGILAGCGGGRSEQARQIGDIHLRNNDLQSAESSYNQAIAADDTNAHAHFGLANVYRLRDKADIALSEYERSIELDPTLDEAYAQSISILLAQSKSDEAMEMAEKLQSLDSLKGGLLMATVQRARGDSTGTTATLEKLKAEHADSVPVRVALAIDYMSEDQPEKAEAELREVVDSIDPSSVQARMALIDVYRVQGKLGEIEAELRSSIEMAEKEAADTPGNGDAANQVAAYKLQLALALLQQEKSQEAFDVVEPVVKATPDSPWANYVYGSCLAGLNRRNEAIQALQAAATALPDEPQIRRKLALVKAQGEGTAGGQQAATDFNAQTPGRPTAPVTGALDTGDWKSLWNAGSLQTLLNSRDKYASNSDPLLADVLAFTAIMVQPGQTELVDELVAKTAEDSPIRKLNQAIRARDGQALGALLSSWKETDPQRDVLRSNGQAFILSIIGRRADALQLLVQTLREHPESGVAYYNSAAMYNAAGMPRFAAHTLERLLQVAPNSLETRALLFQTERRAGMDQEARATAEATYGLFPESRDAILNLASTYLDSDEPELAINVLKRGVESLGSDSGIAIAYGAALIRTGDIESARNVLTQTGWTGIESVRASELIAFCDAHSGDWDAVATGLSALDNKQLTDGGHLLLGAALLLGGKKDAATATILEPAANDEVYQRRIALLAAALGKNDIDGDAGTTAFVEALSGSNEGTSVYAYALGCMEGNMYRHAYDALIHLEEVVGKHPPIATLLMSSLAGSATYPDRVARAEEVEKRYPAVYSLIGLASVYARNGETSKQGMTLQKAVELDPGSEAALLAYALFASQNNQTEEALATYKKLIDMGVKRPAVFNNYAYHLLSSGGDAKVALEYAQLAVDGGMGRDGQVMHTLGLAQFETGDMAEAEKNLIRAAEMLPGDPNTLLDLGRVLQATGREKEGLSLIKQSLLHAEQLGLDFPRKSEAEDIVKAAQA